MNRVKQVINKLAPIVMISVALALSGCAKDNVGSPCPNFGKSCSKTPINSWNYNN